MRQILLVADIVTDVINETNELLKYYFHKIHVIKQLFYFFLGKYDGLAPLEKQYSLSPLLGS